MSMPVRANSCMHKELHQDHLNIPLCVDLDGTLIKTDMLQESIAALLRKQAPLILLLPVWLTNGRAHMKRQILRFAEPAVHNLPVNEDVLAYVRAAKEAGRETVLVTATDQAIADQVAAAFGCFDRVLGSDGNTNYSGSNKAKLLNSLYPEGYEYLGNAPVDLKVWRDAKRVGVVTGHTGFLERVKATFEDVTHFPVAAPSLRELLSAMRIHQWVKNLLLFLPIILAHKLFDLERLLPTAVGFLSFSLCASAVYLLNDIVDLESDRAHISKRNRMFAAGRMPLFVGFYLAPLLFITSLLLGSLVGAKFIWILLFYSTVTSLYSFLLKRIEVLDIVVLALLYTLRIFAGGMAATVSVSAWLLAFSTFFFLSLAALKRYSELFSHLGKSEKKSVAGRGYQPGDLEQIARFGTSSGIVAVLVAALYITSAEVSKLYAWPELIWFQVPLLLYWISRVWLIGARGEMHEDPILFALGDKCSYIVGAIGLALLLIAH